MRLLLLLLIPCLVWPADYTKTVQTELQAITNVSASAQSVSAVLSVSSQLSITVYIDVAPEASNTPGTQFRVESSQKASGNDTWITIGSVVSTSATVNSNAVDGTEAVGQTVIEETTTTGLDRNQYIFFKNTTIGNSEWTRLVSFTGSTSFTIQDGLTNAQTGSTWYNQAERFALKFDLSSIQRIRVVCNNNFGASAVAVNWRAAATTGDAIE